MPLIESLLLAGWRLWGLLCCGSGLSVGESKLFHPINKLVMKKLAILFVSCMAITVMFATEGDECTEAVPPNHNLGKCSKVIGTLHYECIVPHETKNCNGVVIYG